MRAYFQGWQPVAEVRDPDLITMITHHYVNCKRNFARRDQIKTHICEAREARRIREEFTMPGWFPIVSGAPRAKLEGWWIAADGSRQSRKLGKTRIEKAGWGVRIYRMPIVGDIPDFLFHGPVVTQ